MSIENPNQTLVPEKGHKKSESKKGLYSNEIEFLKRKHLYTEKDIKELKPEEILQMRRLINETEFLRNNNYKSEVIDSLDPEQISKIVADIKKERRESKAKRSAEKEKYIVANVKKEALSEIQAGKKSDETLKTAYELAEEKFAKTETQSKKPEAIIKNEEVIEEKQPEMQEVQTEMDLGKTTRSTEDVINSEGLVAGSETENKTERIKIPSSNKRFVEQAARATAKVATPFVGAAASIAGVKSILDVPSYLYQRFKVRGNIFGVGKGKGLAGSVEDLIKASSDKKGNRFEYKSEGMEEKYGKVAAERLRWGKDISIREAIKDLNKRLALTKEGQRSGWLSTDKEGKKSVEISEQRKRIAEILRNSRKQEKMPAEERQKEMKKILDDYTTTKVTGMQAAKEGLNTVIAASGAWSLRLVSYGILDAVGRHQRLEKEAKKTGEKVSFWKDTLVRGVTETLHDARYGNKDHPVMSGVKAWSNIVRYVGMTSIAASNFSGFGHDFEKVFDQFSKVGKGDFFASAAGNIEGGVQRTIEGYEHLFDKGKELFHGAENLFHTTPHIDVHGSHTLWGAIGKGMHQTYGDAFSHANEAQQTYDIDKVRLMIAHDPERYGLKAGVNLDKLSDHAINRINFTKVIEDFNKSGGLAKHLTEAQTHSIIENNSHLKEFFASHPHAPRSGANFDAILKGQGLTGENIDKTSDIKIENTENKELPSLAEYYKKSGEFGIGQGEQYNHGDKLNLNYLAEQQKASELEAELNPAGHAKPYFDLYHHQEGDNLHSLGQDHNTMTNVSTTKPTIENDNLHHFGHNLGTENKVHIPVEQRAEAAFHNMDKNINAFRIFTNEKMSYLDRMHALNNVMKDVKDNQVVNYNSFNFFRRGKEFFAIFGNKSIHITKDNINKIVELPKKALEEYLKKNK